MSPLRAVGTAATVPGCPAVGADGAGTGTVQLRACTEDDECTDSEVKSVEITES